LAPAAEVEVEVEAKVGMAVEAVEYAHLECLQ